MSAGSKKKHQRLKELKCVRCGCTDSFACPGGCSWVTKKPAVCSSCATTAELNAALTRSVRRRG